MLTLITSLRVFRLPRYVVEKTFQCKVAHNKTFFLDYGEAVELEAAVKKEPYTIHLIERALTNLGVELPVIEESYRSFTFICSDGGVTLSCAKESLARHSLLVRGFIEDHPHENRMELLNHRMDSVERVLKTITGEDCFDLTEEDLYTLQTLTPPTDLYYFLFQLPQSIKPTMVLSILRAMTDDERHGVLRQHELTLNWAAERRHEGIYIDNDVRELPDQGRGLAIAYAFSTVRAYLREVHVPELQDPYPSYSFYEMVNYMAYEHYEVGGSHLLLTADFSDDCGILAKDGEEYLIEEILGHCAVVKWSNFCIILAMIGIRDPLLKNEHIDRLAPYQVIAKKGSIHWRHWCGPDSLRDRIERISEIPMEDVDRIMVPYFQQRVEDVD